MRESVVGDLSRALTQVGDRFGSQAIEGGHGHLQMFFARILNLIVADAAKRLHEHHYGRDTGARDFRGVMQWTGGHAVRGWGDLADRLIA